ncbi:unnamed protein product, partial [Candidula unifasciata]
SLISARIRSSRSHESLLASPPSMHSIDLSAPDVEVKPLHSSVLGQGHCFHVSTSQGSKYISCTTSEERDKWISSLRRTIRPHEEHSKRSDSSLKLWILEAKNVATKKRYFCDILLDRTLYAQTSLKMMTDMLFWGEHFEFKNLPVVEIITVNLYREADKKKKKDKNTLVGYVNLLLSDFENRQLVEKWITCNSGTVGKAGKETKNDLPIIRLKARRQTVDILPLEAYQSFIKYLSNDYKKLCQMLEPLLTVREKEDFATCLVHVLQKQGKACEFLSDIVIEEISQLDNEHLTFRGNSIATKAMEAYMKLVGEKYLQDTLGEFIRQLVQSPDDCEVDPTKVSTPQLLNCQQKNLDMYSNMAWVKVINSFCYFPNELREVFASFRSRCNDKGKGDYSDNLISGCIFLRFLCPAILYPSLFNITQEYPNERASRNLTLIAKTIQTLANFTQFGGKEEFMTFMNTFVEREAPSMKSFLHKISSPDAGNQFLEFDGYIDLGKELSVLHALLLECTEKYSESSIAPLKKLSQLSSSSSNDSLNEQLVSSVSSSSHSSHSSNVVHSTSASFISTSSTRTTASVMPFLANSAVNGCSTFPRRHRGQQGQTNRDASPSQPQMETMSTSSVVIDSSSPMSHHCPSVQRQMSTPGHRNAGSGILDTQQPTRPFPKRAGLTTNQTGHLQLRNFHAVKHTAGPSLSDVDNFAQRSNSSSQHSLSTSPMITSRGFSTAGSSAASSTYSSPATQHRLDKSSLLGSPANFKINGNTVTSTTTGVAAASLVSCKGVTHKPPTATTISTGWQIAHHMERSSSSQETSSSSESSPQSLVRSNQHSTSSMHESSSAHSISSAYSPLQPWGYTPSHSDSNSSVNSLTKMHQRAPARSDSSGSLGGVNNSRISQTPSDSNSSVSSGNNNVAGLSNSSQLDNRGLFHNHPNPASFNARLSSISDSQINTLSLQTNPLPQPPAFLTTKYAVVHPNPAGSPRAERVTSYHSNPECTNSSSNISGSYTASRSMDLGYLSKPKDDTIKRAATESFLSPPADGLSPTGSDPSWPLICDDGWQPGSPNINSASNRRLSQQSTVHMGISSVQRKLQEQERAKQEYEQEVHVLRQQLLEAQERLHQAELRLLDHEMETHKLMDEWQYRLVESEEKMRRQQEEKDEQMKSVLSRLQLIEEELKKEQAEMASAVEHRQQVIEVQEQRIRKLDQANNKLLQDLADLKGRALRAAAADENSNSSLCNGILGSAEI